MAVGPFAGHRRQFLRSLHSLTVFRVATLAVILVAFAVRVYRLGAVGIEYDEAFSIHTAFMSMPGILYTVATYEPHPPFYYSFLHFWYPVFGASEFALRFPTVVANVLTIVFLVKLADLFGWRQAGLLGGLLFALSPFQVWYSQEARMYTPVACFGMAALYFAIQAMRRGKARYLAAHVFLLVLALYTHYYAIFLAVFINVFIVAWILAEKDWRRLLFRWMGAQAVVGIVYLPWLAYAYRISLYYTRPPITLHGMLDVITEALSDFSVGTTLPPPIASSLSLGFLTVILAGLWSLGRSRANQPTWRRFSLVAGYLLGPMVMGFGVSFFRSMFQPRYFMVSAPAFYLALGLGLAYLSRVRWSVGLVAGGFLIAVQLGSLRNYFFDPQYNKSEVAAAMMDVGKRVRPGDGVILDGWSQATQFWYYHEVRGLVSAPGYVLPVSGPDGWDVTFPEIDSIMTKHRGIWLLTYGVLEVDAKHLIETYLARNYFQVVSRPIINNRVFYYVAAPPVAPHVTSLDDACNQEILLKDFVSYGTMVRAGDVLPLALRWQDLAPTNRDYVVSWRLLDSQGHTVVQRDSEPASGFSPSGTWTPGQVVVDRYGMLIPTFLAPGDYRIEVLVFDKNSGRVCTFLHGKTAVPGTALPLATVRVLDVPPASPIDDPLPSHPRNASFGALTLQGYDIDPGPYRPGDTLALRLYWRVAKPINANVVATARLLGDSGTVVQERQSILGFAGFPTSRWQPGRTVSTYVDVPIPPNALSGSYRLSLMLGGLGPEAKTDADFSPIRVVARQRHFSVPAIPHPLRATFGGEIDLLGYGISPALTGPTEPGKQIQLTLFWQDARSIRNDYKVFTHLVGPDGKIYGQDDSVPLAGQAPTTSWVPGEVLTDRYGLSVHPNAPDGRYTLIVGFYDPLTGRRLPLSDHPGDSLIVTSFQVSG